MWFLIGNLWNVFVCGTKMGERDHFWKVQIVGIWAHNQGRRSGKWSKKTTATSRFQTDQNGGKKSRKSWTPMGKHYENRSIGDGKTHFYMFCMLRKSFGGQICFNLKKELLWYNLFKQSTFKTCLVQELSSHHSRLSLKFSEKSPQLIWVLENCLEHWIVQIKLTLLQKVTDLSMKSTNYSVPFIENSLRNHNLPLNVVRFPVALFSVR